MMETLLESQEDFMVDVVCVPEKIELYVVDVDVDVWSPIGSQLASTPPFEPLGTARDGTPFRAHRDSVYGPF